MCNFSGGELRLIFRPFSPAARMSQVGGRVDLTPEKATFSSECRELMGKQTYQSSPRNGRE